jgi:hypothetical protein
MDQQQKLVAFTGAKEELVKRGMQIAPTVLTRLVNLGFDEYEAYRKKIREQVWIPEKSEIDNFVMFSMPLFSSFTKGHHIGMSNDWKDQGFDYWYRLPQADRDLYGSFALDRILREVERAVEGKLQVPTQAEIAKLVEDLVDFLSYKRRLRDGR